MGALNASHDLHMLSIDSKEDDITSRLRQDLKVLLEGLQAAELKRGRQKVVEIEQYVGRQWDEVEGSSS